MGVCSVHTKKRPARLLKELVKKPVKKRLKHFFSYFFPAFFIACICIGLFAPVYGGEEGAHKKSTPYAELGEIIIPILQGREVKGFIACKMTLYCEDSDAQQYVQKYLPIVTDRVFWDLYAIFGLIWSDNYRIDVEALKKRVLGVVEKTVGAGFVKQVLVLSIQNRERQNTNVL